MQKIHLKWNSTEHWVEYTSEPDKQQRQPENELWSLQKKKEIKEETAYLKRENTQN